MLTLCEQNVGFRDVKAGATYNKPFPNAVSPTAVLAISS